MNITLDLSSQRRLDEFAQVVAYHMTTAEQPAPSPAPFPMSIAALEAKQNAISRNVEALEIEIEHHARDMAESFVAGGYFQTDQYIRDLGYLKGLKVTLATARVGA